MTPFLWFLVAVAVLLVAAAAIDLLDRRSGRRARRPADINEAVRARRKQLRNARRRTGG